MCDAWGSRGRIDRLQPPIRHWFPAMDRRQKGTVRPTRRIRPNPGTTTRDLHYLHRALPRAGWDACCNFAAVAAAPHAKAQMMKTLIGRVQCGSTEAPAGRRRRTDDRKRSSVAQASQRCRICHYHWFYSVVTSSSDSSFPTGSSLHRPQRGMASFPVSRTWLFDRRSAARTGYRSRPAAQW
jgi:hypothetical protein